MQTQETEQHGVEQQRNMRHAFPEGKTTTAIERKTAQLPSDFFLIAAGGSIVAALALKLSGRGRHANFVGQWAPTFLLLGIYNKLVKMFGTDASPS